MKLTKSDLFIVQLKRVVKELTPYSVKMYIGDSTFNNRTLTVNQVIRYLTISTRNRKFNALGNNLQTAYNSLLPLINEVRSITKSRTDAIDINEFINYYTTFVVALSTQNARKTFSKQFVGEINV